MRNLLLAVLLLGATPAPSGTPPIDYKGLYQTSTTYFQKFVVSVYAPMCVNHKGFSDAKAYNDKAWPADVLCKDWTHLKCTTSDAGVACKAVK